MLKRLEKRRKSHGQVQAQEVAVRRRGQGCAGLHNTRRTARTGRVRKRCSAATLQRGVGGKKQYASGRQSSARSESEGAVATRERLPACWKRNSSGSHKFPCRSGNYGPPSSHVSAVPTVLQNASSVFILCMRESCLNAIVVSLHCATLRIHYPHSRRLLSTNVLSSLLALLHLI